MKMGVSRGLGIFCMFCYDGICKGLYSTMPHN